MSEAKLLPAAPALSLHQRIPQLDGIRGFAVLTVMFAHMTVTTSTAWPDRALVTVSNYCWSGVDLFFVLSGFLITGILWDAKGSTGYFSNFYARRILRIFPLYYFVVFFGAIIAPAISGDERLRLDACGLWYWLFMQNIGCALFHARSNFFVHMTWSLAIEEQYYLLWPMVVLCLSRPTLMRTAGGLILGSCACRLILLHVVGIHPIAAYELSFTRLEGIALGSWLALAMREPATFAALARWAGWVAPLALAIVLGASVVGGGGYLTSPGMQTVGFTAFAFFYGAILVLAVAQQRQGRIGRIFSNGCLRWFGKYSYALYLVHVSIVIALKTRGFRPERFPALWGSCLPGQLIVYLVVLGLSVACALVSWHLFEKHFLGLKDWFQGGKNPTPQREPGLWGAAAIAPSGAVQQPGLSDPPVAFPS